MIQFAQANCKSYACERAFYAGRVIVLGGFDPIPPGTAPGWILTVTSVNQNVWILAVITDDVGHCYHVRQLDRIPWTNWAGSLRAMPNRHSIRDGDIPLQANNACLNAIQGT